jgi:uncharacterized membrane protein YcaP (DUF421 family)
MQTLFDPQAPWWEFVLRGVIVYVFVLALIRLSGKRTVGEFTPFDLIVVILLGETMQGALVPEGESVTGPMIVAATLVGLNWLLAFASTRSKAVDALAEGHPVVLVRDGRLVQKALRSQNVPRSDVEEAIRRANLGGLQEVKLATLETDGEITVVPRKKK